MKKFNLAAGLLLISMVAWGQRGESVNPEKGPPGCRAIPSGYYLP